MFRRPLTVAVVLAAVASVAAPAVPATARHVVACVDAAGPLQLSRGLHVFGTGPAQSADIVTFPFGLTCGFVAWGGHMHGWYGNANGTVTAEDGSGTPHTGTITWAGSAITVTGDIVGTLQVVYDPASPTMPDGPGGEDEFLVSGALAPTGGAELGTGPCAGTGTVTLSAGLYYVLIGPSVSADITSLSFTGTCSLSLVSGSISGNCGNSNGTVTVNDGTRDYTASYTSAGSVLVFTGGFTGVVDAVPAPGESCLPGGAGADTFLIAGSVLFS